VRSDGRRQRVTYSFGSGNEDNTFEINSNNGLIRVRDQKRLDFESSPRLRLIIVAQAEGSSPLYGYATVWVDLLDQNDNSPRFTQDRYTAAVWEGNNKGTFVMQVINIPARFSYAAPQPQWPLPRSSSQPIAVDEGIVRYRANVQSPSPPPSSFV